MGVPPQPRGDHQHRPPASPIPESSVLRPWTQSIHSNGLGTHLHTQAQSRRLRLTPNQSSLQSEGSSHPSSPADPTHQRQIGLKDEDGEVIHERVCNWGVRQRKWTHTHIRRRAASPNPTASHSRVRTTLESDPTTPASSALPRPPNGHLKRRPSKLSLPASAEQHLSSRHPPPPPEAPQELECDKRQHAIRCRRLHNQTLQMDTHTTSLFVCHCATLGQILPWSLLTLMGMAPM